MKYMLSILIAGFLLISLAACGGGATSITKPTAGAPTAAAAQPTVPPEPTHVTLPTTPPLPTAQLGQTPTSAPRATAPAKPAGDSGALVVLHKSGGIMGLDETLTVNADGTLALRGRDGSTKTAKVSPDRLAKLRDLLASPDFAKLNTQYESGGADVFVYDITVPGGTPAHVQTMDGVENPLVLTQIIQELNSLMNQV